MRTVFGITGGTGCGKTTALLALEQLGVHIIDCDAVYHRLLQTSTDMLRAIDLTFPGVVENGVLQRKKLGAHVFSNPDALQLLNNITGKFVLEAVTQELDSHPGQPCAIDAIGLLESGLAELCTVTVAVTASEDVRAVRLMKREGISEEYARLRIRAQKPNAYFSDACTLTLCNDFSSAEEFLQYSKDHLSKYL